MDLLARGETGRAVDTTRFRFAAALTGIFLVLAGVGAIRHELWRDEMQAWLIARDVPDLGALLEQVHYEGAPPLWILLLRPLALLTHRPEAMQLFNWVLAGITIFVFCQFAPISRLLKVLLVANYYLLFEYGIVCRNYLPAVLFLGVACILYPSARERPWPFCLSLVVAAMASVHSLIVAVAIAAGFWGSWGLEAIRGKGKPDSTARGFHYPSLLAFALGVGLAVYSMLPRPDTLYVPAREWIFHWIPSRMAKVSWAFVSAHFPWPRPPGYFWIPAWDTPFPSFDDNVAFGLAFALFGGSVLLLRRHLGSLLCYLVGTLGVSTFLYVKYLGFSRHTAFLFFAFLFAFWIKKTDGALRGNGFSVWSGRAAELALAVMLTMQAVTGLAAVREDFDRPFSCGKLSAKIIQEHHLQNAFLAVGLDWAGAPLAGYLDRSLYFPNALRYGSYTRWETRRIDNFLLLGDEECFRRVAQEAKGREIVLSLDHPLPAAFMQEHGIQPLAEVLGSLTPFEDYYLYYIPGKPGAAATSAAF